MSITSYAQNFEDVMLWRALSHIEDDVCIDIGAQDSIIDSVSLAFHKRGWNGLRAVERWFSKNTLAESKCLYGTLEQRVCGQIQQSSFGDH
jgi:hypothetical protein